MLLHAVPACILTATAASVNCADCYDAAPYGGPPKTAMVSVQGSMTVSPYDVDSFTWLHDRLVCVTWTHAYVVEDSFPA